jgi:TetR/AcrR family transcriptional regulator
MASTTTATKTAEAGTTRSRDPEATRIAILDAAEDAFLEKGFAETSTAQIARRAGVTKSLIHHHFGSKEALWNEVKTRRFTGYSEQQMTMLREQAPTAELLRESMKMYFRYLRSNPQLVRVMAWMFIEGNQSEDCADLDRELTLAGIDKIRQAQERGELRADLNPGFILFTFIGIAQHWYQDKGLMLDKIGLSADSDAVDEAYLQDAVRIFFEGVLPR